MRGNAFARTPTDASVACKATDILYQRNIAVIIVAYTQQERERARASRLRGMLNRVIVRKGHCDLNIGSR